MHKQGSYFRQWGYVQQSISHYTINIYIDLILELIENQYIDWKKLLSIIW